MPLVTIPITARDRYFAMCDEYNHPDTDSRRRKWLTFEIGGYKQALRDILPAESVGSILIEADLRLPDDGRPISSGMYMDMKEK